MSGDLGEGGVDIVDDRPSVSSRAAGSIAADPIPNCSFADRTAGWFDGSGQTCSEICSEHNAVAEREDNTAPPADKSFVCKVRKAEGGPNQWRFGTQFADRAACYATAFDLKGEYSQTYYCLCVKRVLRMGGVRR